MQSAKMRALASSQEEPTSGFRSYSSQARFDYRFFPFAKFPVIEPHFTIEFIQLGPNFPSLFRIELRQCFEDLGLDHGEIYRGQSRGSKQAFGQETVPLPCST